MRRAIFLLAAAVVLPIVAGCTGVSCNDTVAPLGATPYSVADETGTSPLPATVNMSVSGPIGR